MSTLLWMAQGSFERFVIFLLLLVFCCGVLTSLVDLHRFGIIFQGSNALVPKDSYCASGAILDLDSCRE